MDVIFNVGRTVGGFIISGLLLCSSYKPQTKLGGGGGGGGGRKLSPCLSICQTVHLSIVVSLYSISTMSIDGFWLNLTKVYTSLRWYSIPNSVSICPAVVNRGYLVFCLYLVVLVVLVTQKTAFQFLQSIYFQNIIKEPV